MTPWKSLEEKVKVLASLRWGCSAGPEHIDGTDFDCVLRPSADEIIIIEATKNHTIEKIRGDLVRIALLRSNLMSSGILCRGFIVLANEPTAAMAEAGSKNRISIQSLQQFEKGFFDQNSYIELRKSQPFGSAVNPLTGQSDQMPYVKVTYVDDATEKHLNVDEIAKLLAAGKRILLTGDFGTGKSRCGREVFELLTEKAKKSPSEAYVFAINLRDHWGARSAIEILSGHLAGVGFSSSFDNAIRLLNAGALTLILDGFDEVGAQTFGVDRKRSGIRRLALQGVRDLIHRSPAGVIIMGRSHYFDNDHEMVDAIGLRSDGREFDHIHCAQEFSEAEAKTYLASIGLSNSLPNWLPRKPLVFQVISSLPKEGAAGLLNDSQSEVPFWGHFMEVISTREARIHGSLDSSSVHLFLMGLAQETRLGEQPLGKLSPRTISDVYERVMGEAPDEAGQTMIMRLCTLTRIAADSPERQFADNYIVDGLKADAFVHAIENQDRTFWDAVWKQPLNALGTSILTESINSSDHGNLYLSLLSALSSRRNNQALAELISALTFAARGTVVDCHNTLVQNSELHFLNLGAGAISNITFRNCIIDHLFLEGVSTSSSLNVSVESCIISDVYDIGGSEGLPEWISNSEISRFEDLSNPDRISEQAAKMTPSQKLLLGIVHKIFFQPGAARKEAALLKGGFGQKFDPKLVSKIINVLINDGVITKGRGDEGAIYAPVRSHTRRMRSMRAQLSLCTDPLWIKVGEL